MHREDTDLAWRVMDAGFKMAWAPQCRVHHPEPMGWHEDGIPGSSKFGVYPRSEQLLYHCNRRKFVESAASLISRESISDGSLWKLQRNLRTLQDPPDVKPLTRFQSWTLWSRAWTLAVFWIVRKIVVGEPRKSIHSIK